MSDQQHPFHAAGGKGGQGGSSKGSGILGSLKDALVAASRDDSIDKPPMKNITPPPVPMQALPPPQVELIAKDGAPPKPKEGSTMLTAKEAARESRGSSSVREEASPMEGNEPPTTRVLRGKEKSQENPARTQLVRGRATVKRGEFAVDPVVGWLVIVGGPGIGQYRAIFEGNNSIGRSSTNRIAIDFGDEAISSDEQAYIRYDSPDRSFLFVPNLAKTNVVSLNEKKPTGPVTLSAMDVITMGRTQLVFVPFCGSEFDWSALGDK